MFKGLYSIVDPDYCNGRDPVDVARQVLRARVRLLQLRAKNWKQADVLALARGICALKAEFDFTFIVNDDVELMLASSADGLHIGQGDLPAAEARTRLGKGKFLGLSTHSLDEIRVANTLPVDYIGFGGIFKTATKGEAHPVQGLERLREAVKLSTHPVVAIGGINADNLLSVVQTGVRSYAVLSAITQAPDVLEAARLFEFMPVILT